MSGYHFLALIVSLLRVRFLVQKMTKNDTKKWSKKGWFLKNMDFDPKSAFLDLWKKAENLKIAT
jgi:hypothetical protein